MPEWMLPHAGIAQGSAWVMRMLRIYSPVLAAIALLAGPVTVAIVIGA